MYESLLKIFNKVSIINSTGTKSAKFPGYFNI